MAVQWPGGVNTKIYGLSSGAEENYVEVKFESGKRRRFLKNTKASKTHSFNLNLYSKEEELTFWAWYNDTLKCGAESFVLADLINHDVNKTYLLASTPSVDGGQYPKVLTLEVIEE